LRAKQESLILERRGERKVLSGGGKGSREVGTRRKKGRRRHPGILGERVPTYSHPKSTGSTVCLIPNKSGEVFHHIESEEAGRGNRRSTRRKKERSHVVRQAAQVRGERGGAPRQRDKRRTLGNRRRFIISSRENQKKKKKDI